MERYVGAHTGKGAFKVLFRQLTASELDAIWAIDRSEFIGSTYRCSEGALVEEPLNLDLAGWPPRDREIYAPILADCFAHGGYFEGAFDQGRLVGAVVLGDRRLGKAQDQLQLKLMYVDRVYRKTGLGRRLFELAVAEARRRGAGRLYISSCETKNTVDFYLHLGCRLTGEVDPELFALEPNDIHLEFTIPPLVDAETLRTIERYFEGHPVLGRHLERVAVCLTGSHALGLGGRGADLDFKVIAPQAAFDVIRQELVAAGRDAGAEDPGEELTELVGDYSLEPLDQAWAAVRDYGDLTQVFIYGHLLRILGKRDLVDELVGHCLAIPEKVLQEEVRREEDRLSEAIYAFLRSFQTGDEPGRLLARANLVRSAMRLAYLREAKAPPYDKHLFRLLPGLHRGAELAEAVRAFVQQGEAAEEERYRPVAGSEDWHEMYRQAEGTPVMVFLAKVRTLLQLA